MRVEIYWEPSVIELLPEEIEHIAPEEMSLRVLAKAVNDRLLKYPKQGMPSISHVDADWISPGIKGAVHSSDSCEKRNMLFGIKLSSTTLDKGEV